MDNDYRDNEEEEDGKTIDLGDEEDLAANGFSIDGDSLEEEEPSFVGADEEEPEADF